MTSFTEQRRQQSSFEKNNLPLIPKRKDGHEIVC